MKNGGGWFDPGPKHSETPSSRNESVRVRAARRLAVTQLEGFDSPLSPKFKFYPGIVGIWVGRHVVSVCRGGFDSRRSRQNKHRSEVMVTSRIPTPEDRVQFLAGLPPRRGLTWGDRPRGRRRCRKPKIRVRFPVAPPVRRGRSSSRRALVWLTGDGGASPPDSTTRGYSSRAEPLASNQLMSVRFRLSAPSPFGVTPRGRPDGDGLGVPHR